MTEVIITFAEIVINCLLAVGTLAFLVFSIDATFGRFLGFRRLLRHRGKGPFAVIGEMGILILIGTAVAEPYARGTIAPFWFVLIVIAALIMGFIGQGASQAAGPHHVVESKEELTKSPVNAEVNSS